MTALLRWLVALASLSSAAALATVPVVYTPGPGTHAVTIWTGTWHDEARDRDIPVKIYAPADATDAPYPVIVFSHGLGGTKDGYSYLGEYWAAHGYVSVHLQHLGSDDAVWKGLGPLRALHKMAEAADDPANLKNRPLDVRFAIDRLVALEKDKTFVFAGKLDTDRLAVAGHSFGAYTVMAVVGQGIGPDAFLTYYGPDPRIKAAIAMSSQPAHTRNLDDAYAKVTIPIFHMTGTNDKSPFPGRSKESIIGGTTPEGRRVAYDHTRNAPAYLVVFAGGDHMLFSGRGALSGGDHDAEYQPIVCYASTAFWDATLKKDPLAQAYLDGGGFAAALGSRGTFERKPTPGTPSK